MSDKEKFELAKEDLEKVVGGKLSKQASAWLNKYESQLMQIARQKGLEKDAINGLALAKSALTPEISLDTLKSFLEGYGIDLSQFN